MEINEVTQGKKKAKKDIDTAVVRKFLPVCYVMTLLFAFLPTIWGLALPISNDIEIVDAGQAIFQIMWLGLSQMSLKFSLLVGGISAVSGVLTWRYTKEMWSIYKAFLVVQIILAIQFVVTQCLVR